MDLIPKRGQIRVEDDQILFYRDGNRIGSMFIGEDGLIIEGIEVTLFSDQDPAALRFASRYPDSHGAVGKISFNHLRSDGRQDEIAYWKGAQAEDCQPGELRGQFEIRVRETHADSESMVLALIATTAYSVELFSEAKVYTGFRRPQPNLWKFE